jgi:serine/threonine protein phosphatase 1
MATKKFLVVGDVHGCSGQLRALLAQHDLYEDRRVVFLGDFVDVGPDTPGVIELLLAFGSERPDTIFLLGNHDLALLKYLRSGDFAAYAEMGGIATIRAYCGYVYGDVHGALERRIPERHRAFLQDLRPYFETKDYLFSHCGYPPGSPLDRSLEAMVLQSHQRLFDNGASLGKLAVCGHYFQRTLTPFVSESVICLDTGCGILAGPLSAVLLPELRLVQVSTDLRLSTGTTQGTEAAITVE